jgi:DnaJ-domain-containing protein 1
VEREDRRNRAGATASPPLAEESGIDDPFAILGITRTATPEEAKSAWRALVSKYHPDKVAHLATEFQELAEKRTREINGAYEAVERMLAPRTGE